MDDYDVIYLDDEERNAYDHRTGSSQPVRVRGPRPGTIVVPPSRRPTVIRAGGGVRQVSGGRPTQVVIQQPASRLALGGMAAGELVEMAAQILAAIQPLPVAPTAQGYVETDVENLVIYQTALATHAKRDEQLRTLGGLLGKILK